MQQAPPKDNIVLTYPADMSGCGFLRTIYPHDMLSSMYGNAKKYEGIVSTRFFLEQNLIAKASTIKLQRQCTDQQLEYIEILKAVRDKHNFKYQFVYDLDDLFTDIPSYNFAHNFYNQPFVKQNIQRIVNIVDVFTVTTYDLKKQIEKYNGTCKVKIVPNYVPKYIYRPYEGWDREETKKPKVVWAGSATHFNDFDMGDFRVILDLMKNTLDDFEWVLMGLNPEKIPTWLKPYVDTGKIQIHKWIRNLHNFPSELKRLNADFGLAPLIDNSFNRSKSDIKCTDYASADIVTMASNLAPYKKTAQLFFSGDWKTDRDTIIEVFQNKEKKELIIEKQKKILNKMWLENNIGKYRELFNIHGGNK